MGLDAGIHRILEALRKGQLLLSVLRQGNLLHVPPGEIREALLTQHIAAAVLDLRRHLGLCHMGSALRHQREPPENVLHIGDMRCSREIPGARLVRHDVRREAAAVRGVVDPGLIRHMLPQVIGTHAAELHRIQCASSPLRGEGRMTGLSLEEEFNGGTGEITGLVDHICGHGMPAEGHVAAVKHMIIRHLHLAGEELLLGAAVETHGSRQLLLLQEAADGDGRGQCCRAQEIVAAAVARGPRCHSLLGDLTFLGQSRQGIVLAQHRDHRAAAAVLSVKGIGQLRLVHNPKALVRKDLSEEI